MKIHSKLVAVAAALAFGCVMLAGCGSSASSTSAASSSAASEETPASSVLAAASAPALDDANGDDTDDLAGAVDGLLETNPISNPFELTALNIEYDFYLEPEDVTTYKGVRSNDNGDAGLVLIVEAADGKADSVIEGMKSYQQALIDQAGNYAAEFAQALENAKNAIITSSGNRVVMVVASNECTASSAELTAAAEAALNQ